MKIQSLRLAALAVLIQTSSFSLAGGEPPSIEEMWRVIQSQQREIEILRSRLESTDQKAEAAVVAVEDVAATSAKSSWAEKTHFGGYGELHYNNLDGDGGASDKEEIDFHRFVLEFGHEFNERIRLYTELEVEHAFIADNNDDSSNEAPGAVELEQAYIEFDINDRFSAKGGLFLVPVGILNETHEPTTFFGVERNPIEKNIIPTTWWVGGAGLTAEIAPGLSFDLALHEGLKTKASNGYKPRNGRQKTAEAGVNNPALTARVKWTGMPGLEIAGSFQYQDNVTQATDPTAGSANLYELHGVWTRGPIGLRALYARWELEGSGPKSIGADKQDGFYIEPSYKFSKELGIYARFNQWDNAAGSSSDSEKQQIDVGVNWWPHQDVVIKADYQIQDNDDGKEQEGVNLGIGYQF